MIINELAGYVVRSECFQPFSSQRDFFFLWSQSPVYSGVAEAAVQPAVGIRGGVFVPTGFSYATYIKVTVYLAERKNFRSSERVKLLQ